MASAILHRELNQKLATAVRGDGVYLFDSSGASYIDASGGAAVSCLGHNHPALREAIYEQLTRLEYAHTSFFTNEPAEMLATRLIQRAPAGFGKGRVGFLGSGSESVEAALKLARQYHVECGAPERTTFIAREMSYHGNTLGALAVGGHRGRRALYAPLLMQAEFVSPCYAYRFCDTDVDDYVERLCLELISKIEGIGPESVAGFIAEPVVGATLGSVPAVAGYFRRVREICDHYGILLIADEVMCGSGRTGEFFAISSEGVVPDIITIAKGLGAGYQPIGAVLASAKVVAALEAGTGALANGHTYMSHAVACAASLAVLDVIDEQGLLGRVQHLGVRLEQTLRSRFGAHPYVGDIRGRGLMWSLEFVADRESRAPFEVGRRLAGRLKAVGLEKGLICYPSSGTADGVNGDHVLLAPPYIASEDHIEEIADKLESTVQAVFAELRV